MDRRPRANSSGRRGTLDAAISLSLPDAKTIKDDLGENFPDIHAAGEHARRMARELASEPHESGAAIVVSDGHQELFEVALADYR